ncbi:hypothetical protein JX266_007134 [Neoarthrinium moseri]|nr:hypothetical protein JX266_007134 [Neoarthrinium moseri]
MAKIVSEAAREREALKYATVFCHLADAAASPKQASALASTSSGDCGLTAFAQLGVLRLGAARCLISIFDQRNQYVVAEATPSSALTPNASQPDELWLGCTAIPRSSSVCGHLLTTDVEQSTERPNALSTALPVSVIPDLTKDPRFQGEAHVLGSPHNRFYAGVPLRTSRGIHIGAYGIFDDKPRDGLDPLQIEFMRLMSQAVMSHLELRRSAESSGRSERMVRGIGSFVEGRSTMSNLWRGTNPAAFEQNSVEGKLNSNQQLIQQANADRDLSLNKTAEGVSRAMANNATIPPFQKPASASERESKGDNPSPSPPLRDAREGGSSGQDTRSATDETTALTKFTLHSGGSVTSIAAKSFADELHTVEFRETFGRASNIIRESIEVEGVAFLDAMVDTFGGLVPKDGGSETTSSDSQPDGSGSEGDQGKKEEPEQKFCKIIGFSTSDASSVDGKVNDNYQLNISQNFLRTLIRRYPTGKTFTFDNEGDIVSGDSEEDPTHVSDPDATSSQVSLQERKRKVTQSRQSESAVLTSVLKGARSIAMVPLWDPVREKWHATAFVWTKSPDRIFSVEKEISYLRAFGATIMAEISRLEAANSEKMKSDLLGSLSHELRSPLHGVLAGIDLMQETEVDAFQGDTLHSMESCGRTLLDVIEHLLDFSKLNRFVQSAKAQKKNRKHGNRQLKDQQQSFESKMTPLAIDVDLSVLIEETVESVHAGFNYGHSRRDQSSQAHSQESLYNQGSFTYQADQGAVRASNGAVSIYLDIDANVKWTRHIQPGGLRRIIMNILGNSMKYTDTGYIIVKMRQIKVPLKRNRYQTNLKLTVTDSGKGIGPDFLRDKLFTPFSQEDSLQPGTGLGLSLIQQIITLLKGSIAVESQLGRGTSIEVTVPLPPAPAETAAEHSGSLGSSVACLKGLRVSLRGFKESPDTSGLPHCPAPIERQLLATSCQTWLQLEIVPEDSEETRPDCIICSDLSLDEIVQKSPRLLPPIVVVCQNGTVARGLSQKYRLESSTDSVEFIAQPIGPHKLSKALLLAMERWKKFTTSFTVPANAIATPSSEPSAVDPASSTNRGPHSSSPSQPILTLPLNPLVDTVADQPTKDHNESGSVHPAIAATQTHATNSDPETDSNGSQALTDFLLVDDNKINLQILSAFMKKMKRPYDIAHDGLEALQTYSSTPGHFRCVLMDISMPVMDGLEATRRIREFEQARQLPRSLIVALTGMASTKVQQEAFGSGVDFFLPKPVRLNQLTELLRDKGLDLA